MSLVDLGRCTYLAPGEVGKKGMEIGLIGLDGIGSQLPFHR
jgi:hypothetical protein